MRRQGRCAYAPAHRERHARCLESHRFLVSPGAARCFEQGIRCCLDSGGCVRAEAGSHAGRCRSRSPPRPRRLHVRGCRPQSRARYRNRFVFGVGRALNRRGRKVFGHRWRTDSLRSYAQSTWRERCPQSAKSSWTISRLRRSSMKCGASGWRVREGPGRTRADRRLNLNLHSPPASARLPATREMACLPHKNRRKADDAYATHLNGVVP